MTSRTGTTSSLTGLFTQDQVTASDVDATEPRPCHLPEVDESRLPSLGEFIAMGGSKPTETLPGSAYDYETERGWVTLIDADHPDGMHNALVMRTGARTVAVLVEAADSSECEVYDIDTEDFDPSRHEFD